MDPKVEDRCVSNTGSTSSKIIDLGEISGMSGLEMWMPFWRTFTEKLTTCISTCN